jgi:ParB family chromosome partitioning protein
MSEQLLWVKCSSIVPNRYQPRKDFNTKELEELAESIDQQGLIQPITIRKIVDGADGIEYELIAGERRWRATHEILGKDKIRAIVKEMTDEASQEAAITENLQRSNLNAMEEAIALQNLMDNFGLTQEQVSKRIGKSRSYISNICRLLKLPEEIQAFVATDQLEKHKAWSLLAVEKVEKQVDLAKKCIQKNWTFERLRSEIESAIVKAVEEPPKPLEKVVTEIHTATGEVKQVEVTKPATPRQSLHGNRKIKPKANTEFMVLVEFDSNETVDDFIKFMKEQQWSCWKGDAALKKLKDIEVTPVAELPEATLDI